jgi:tetratricopeptide (TPR) repeat protein
LDNIGEKPIFAVKMKRIVYLVIVIGVLLGCGERREYREMLSRAEEMMNDHPDSALMILDSLGQHEKEFGRHFRMQFLLHRTNAASKTSERFSSDSLVKDLADHFDSRGTTNERVLAHYLLGLAYSDMGEAPKAINSFQNAIEAADTTASDFNFATLSCTFSQMADIYRL